jgi:hypothetical protein
MVGKNMLSFKFSSCLHLIPFTPISCGDIQAMLLPTIEVILHVYKCSSLWNWCWTLINNIFWCDNIGDTYLSTNFFFQEKTCQPTQCFMQGRKTLTCMLTIILCESELHISCPRTFLFQGVIRWRIVSLNLVHVDSWTVSWTTSASRSRDWGMLLDNIKVSLYVAILCI